MRSRTSFRARSSSLTSSAELSISAERTTNGDRSKPKASSISPPPTLPRVALPVRAIATDDQAGVHEHREMPSQRCRRHAVRPEGQLLVRREDDELFARENGLRVKGQQGVEHCQGSFIHAEPSLGRADISEQIPFVDRALGRSFLRERLVCHMDKRQRPPPEGRRRNMRDHLPSPIARQKKSARRNGAESLARLLTVIRGSAILSLFRTKKGFRNSFRGPFLLRSSSPGCGLLASPILAASDAAQTGGAIH